MRVKGEVGLNEAYKFFRQENKELKIDRTTYKKICYMFNKSICKDVLDGKIIKLPHALGTLYIKKYKMNLDKPKLDLNETKKAGKKIYHLNFHSDGYQVRWYWSKFNSLMRNLYFYRFKPTRYNSRDLAKIMKQEGGHKRYTS